MHTPLTIASPGPDTTVPIVTSARRDADSVSKAHRPAP
jgi:hypothetical protein